MNVATALCWQRITSLFSVIQVGVVCLASAYRERLGNHQSRSMNRSTALCRQRANSLFSVAQMGVVCLALAHRERRATTNHGKLSAATAICQQGKTQSLYLTNLTLSTVLSAANVSCDGRGGESIGRSRGLSPRPSSTHLLAHYLKS